MLTRARNSALACDCLGFPIFGLSPRNNGALRPAHLGTGSKSYRRNFTRCSRAGSDEFIDFGLRPSNGARSDLDRSRELVRPHQPINCGTAEAGSFLDFLAAEQTVVHWGILQVYFPEDAACARALRPICFPRSRRANEGRADMQICRSATREKRCRSKFLQSPCSSYPLRFRQHRMLIRLRSMLRAGVLVSASCSALPESLETPSAERPP